MIGWTDPGDPEGRVIPASRHPLLLRAEMEAEDVYTTWRMLYELPPTDPRALEADEDLVAYDLAVNYYYRRAMERALNPGAAAVREASASPEYAEDLVRRNEEWLRTGDTQARIARMLGRRYDQGPQAPVSIRLTRTRT